MKKTFLFKVITATLLFGMTLSSCDFGDNEGNSNTENSNPVIYDNNNGENGENDRNKKDEGSNGGVNDENNTDNNGENGGNGGKNDDKDTIGTGKTYQEFENKNPIVLTLDTWKELNNITEAWFKFTATSSGHGIFVSSSGADARFTVYDSSGTEMKENKNFIDDTKKRTSFLLDSAKKTDAYYIKVQATRGANLKIGFTETPAQPGTTITTLTKNTWTEASREEWFKIEPEENVSSEKIFIQSDSTDGKNVYIYENCKEISAPSSENNYLYDKEITKEVSTHYGKPLYIKVISQYVGESYKITYGSKPE